MLFENLLRVDYKKLAHIINDKTSSSYSTDIIRKWHKGSFKSAKIEEAVEKISLPYRYDYSILTKELNEEYQGDYDKNYVRDIVTGVRTSATVKKRVNDMIYKAVFQSILKAKGETVQKKATKKELLEKVCSLFGVSVEEVNDCNSILELIKTLQKKEGNSPCFGAGSQGVSCSEKGCCWFSLCQSGVEL